MNNTITNVFLGLAIVLLAYMAFVKVVPAFGAASPTGATFNDAKVAEIAMVPIDLTSTTTSILNTDGSDRVVDSSFVSCATTSQTVFGSHGAGLATWAFQMATTAVANLGLQGNTNHVADLTVPTSTADASYVASSSIPVLGNRNRIWPANTYLSMLSVGSSTNATITCQAGVYYHGT